MVLPTHTNFKLLLLPTQAGIFYANSYKHRISHFKSIFTTFLGLGKRWKSISVVRQKMEILVITLSSNNCRAKQVNHSQVCSIENCYICIQIVTEKPFTSK